MIEVTKYEEQILFTTTQTCNNNKNTTKLGKFVTNDENFYRRRVICVFVYYRELFVYL